MDSKNNIRNWLNTGLLAVCAVSLVVIVVLLLNLSKAVGGADVVSDNKSDTAQVTTTAITEMADIETEYGNVKFPLQLKQYLEYEEVKADDSTEYVFYCNLNDEKIELYSIIFGGSDDGDVAGYLEQNDERIPVKVESNEIPVDNLSDDELQILQGMSGTYSDILVSISEWDGFVYE